MNRIIQKSGISDNRGFSLLEIMVSTVILIVIVLMMSTIFHQSSVSWDAGIRKANGNMIGRGVLGMIARELAGAMADPDYLYNFEIGGGTAGTRIKFATLGGIPSNTGQRAAIQIEYILSGSDISRVCRTSTSPYGSSWVNPVNTIVANNIDGSSGPGLYFEASPEWTPPSPAGSTLPQWVRVTLRITKNADVSGVGAKSAGPDKNFGTTNDNIRSY